MRSATLFFFAIVAIALVSADVRSIIDAFAPSFPRDWSSVIISDVNLPPLPKSRSFVPILSTPIKYAVDFGNNTHGLDGFNVEFRANLTSYTYLNIPGGNETCQCTKVVRIESPNLNGFTNTKKPCTLYGRVGLLWSNTSVSTGSQGTVTTTVAVCFGFNRPLFYILTVETVTDGKKVTGTARSVFTQFSSPADPKLNKKFSLPSKCWSVACV